MKRFDKRYIYYSFLSDFFGSLMVSFALFCGIFSESESELDYIIPLIPIFAILFVVIYICFIAYRIVYYKTSGYELTETEIKCKRGVFFRKRSVLDYKNVHAINKKQNIIQRIFGIAVLTVDSGSANTSHQAEITVIEKENIVNALLDELNALKEKGARNVIDESKEEVLLSDNDSAYNFTSKKKMLYTLINIASTAFFTLLFGVLAIIVIGACKSMLQLDFFGTWGEYFLSSALITAGVILVSSFFSFIGCMIHSFIGYYKFTVTKHGNEIRISFGLLERHTNTFSYDRIKAVKISQGLVQRTLGFASIKLEVIGYTNDTGKENTEIGVLVPFCKYGEIGEILDKVLPDYIPDEKQTKAVSFFPFVSWFFLIVGIITGVTLLTTIAILLILNVSFSVILGVALCILGAGLVLIAIKSIKSALAYQINGISINNGKITVYNGGFTKNVTVFMRKNLVALENVTTPLRQKAGIASLVMHLKTNAASNEVKVHIQKDNLSEDVERLLIL